MTNLQIIAALPTWFTVSEFATAANISHQKARKVLGNLYRDHLVDKRVTNYDETAYLWQYEWSITEKGFSRVNGDDKCQHAATQEIASFSDENGQEYFVDRCHQGCGRLVISWREPGENVTKTQAIGPEKAG